MDLLIKYSQDLMVGILNPDPAKKEKKKGPKPDPHTTE
jgi:hypothetical protein